MTCTGYLGITESDLPTPAPTICSSFLLAEMAALQDKDVDGSLFLSINSSVPVRFSSGFTRTMHLYHARNGDRHSGEEQ